MLAEIKTVKEGGGIRTVWFKGRPLSVVIALLFARTAAELMTQRRCSMA